MKDKTVLMVLGVIILVILFWPINKSYNNIQPIPANKPDFYFKNAGHESWDCGQGYYTDSKMPLLCKKNGT